MLALLALPVPVWAQGDPQLLVGSRIRVTPLEGQVLKGSFQGSGPQGLTVSDEKGNLQLLANESIQSLDISAGKNRRKGALIGGGIGLVAGVLIGAATSGDCAGGCDDSYGIGGSLVEATATASGAILGGLVFGGLGAVLGGWVFAPERWLRARF